MKSAAMIYCDSGVISHEICKREILQFLCNISWNLQPWDIEVRVWYLMKSATRRYRILLGGWTNSCILAEFIGISFLKRTLSMQLFLWIGIAMIWSPEAESDEQRSGIVTANILLFLQTLPVLIAEIKRMLQSCMVMH